MRLRVFSGAQLLSRLEATRNAPTIPQLRLQNNSAIEVCLIMDAHQSPERRQGRMLHSSHSKRFFAVLLVLQFVLPAAQATPASQQPAMPSAQKQSTPPGQMDEQIMAIPDAPSPQQAPQSAQQAASQSDSQSQQSSPAAPIGTAAAPAEEPVGAAGSRPAGAVIAPAKQRRVHTILIRVGLIVGASIAIGTVAALSHATPSQPH